MAETSTDNDVFLPAWKYNISMCFILYFIALFYYLPGIFNIIVSDGANSAKLFISKACLFSLRSRDGLCGMA